MKVLLTGEPGVGKTTAVKGFIAQTQAAFWVVSEEIRSSAGNREGFQALNSTGIRSVFAHKTAIASKAHIGSFKVDIEAIDRVFTDPMAVALNQNKKLFIIDEIGRMEMLSPAFRHVIGKISTSSAHLVATIPQEEEWAHEYINGPETILLTLTKENRKELASVLSNIVAGLDVFGTLSNARQEKILRLAKMYAGTNQLIQLNKLFKNAIRYINEDRVQVSQKGVITVRGYTNTHVVEIEGDDWQCDCDLSNGRGQFSSMPGECSHIQAALIL